VGKISASQERFLGIARTGLSFRQYICDGRGSQGTGGWRGGDGFSAAAAAENNFSIDKGRFSSRQLA
jgi:hypothetical protein